jgi:hypothetical protein
MEYQITDGDRLSTSTSEITLQPLSVDEQNRLVDNLLAIADLPQAVRRLILERSEGNPFYLEEIVRSLIEQGAIVGEGEIRQTTQELQTIILPDTLQGVLLARIDRLQEAMPYPSSWLGDRQEPCTACSKRLPKLNKSLIDTFSCKGGLVRKNPGYLNWKHVQTLPDAGAAYNCC